MRIISKKKDYYEVGQAYGQDPTQIWIRNPETVKYAVPTLTERWVKRTDFPFPHTDTQHSGFARSINVKQRIIGFCGKIYPLLELGVGFDPPTTLCYTMAEVDAFVESHFKERQIEAYKTKSKKWLWRRTNQHWPHNRRQEALMTFFAECEQKQNAFEQIFQEKRCPVFVAEYHGWNEAEITYHYSDLKNLDFMRIFDPLTAYQEISMYFGNMAVPLKSIPDIDDKTLSEAKGFDRFSFRKDKQKK